MLYLLAGASRSGKSLIATRFVSELNAPYFCLDYFVSVFARGAPELGIGHDLPNIERAERLWPLLKPMLIHIADVEPHYLIDGDALLPKHVHELLTEHQHDIRACFVGYADVDPNQKLQDIRQHAGAINDWTKEHDDAYVLRHVKEMIEFSRYLKTECERFHLAYFDVSADFHSVLDKAFASLRGETEG